MVCVKTAVEISEESRQDEDGWLGYLEEYPDYWTQGDSLDELGKQLKDLYFDLTSGQIPVLPFLMQDQSNRAFRPLAIWRMCSIE